MKRFVTGTLVALLLAMMLPTGSVRAAAIVLSFTGLPPVTYGDAPIAIGPYVTDDGSANPITYNSTTPSVCDMSGANITILGAGSCSITATQSAVDSTDSFNVAKAGQTLGFDISAANKAYGAAPFSLTPFTTPGGSSASVSYVSETLSVCTVGGSTLTILTAGDCTVKASQAGDTNYNAAADQTSTLTVAKANQTLGFDISAANKTYGAAPFSLTPFTTPGGSSASVTYASQTLSACTVSGATLTIVTAGNCTVKASQAGDANHNAAADATSTLNVAKASQTLLFDITGAGKTYGDAPFSLSGFTTAGASSASVTYASQTTPVCTVAGSTVTIHTAGNCTIKASQAGDTNYNAASDVTSTASIAKASQTLGFDISAANKTYGAAPFSLTPFTTPGASSASVTYTSLTLSACTVSGSTLTIHTAGTCTLKASQAGDTNYNAAPDATSTLSVSKANQTLLFDISAANKTYGAAPFSLTPFTTAGGSSAAVTYASQTLSACTVSGSSLTILTAGNCTVKASQAGDTNYNAASDATSTVNVAKANQTLSFDISAANKTYGAAPFSLTPFTTAGGSSASVTYASQTLSACTVSGSTLTILTAGNCTVKASQAGDGNYNAAADQTSTLNVAKANQVLGFDVSAANKTYGAAPFSLTPFTTPGPGTGAVSYSSTTLSVCTVSGSTLTIVHAGTCTLNALQAADGNYNADSAGPSSFTVAKANPACVITGYTVVFDGLSHTAAGNCLGTDGITVLSGLNKSATTHTNAGTYSNNAWSFTDGTGNYNNASGQVTSSIAAANPDCSSISGYAVAYTGDPHTASGSCLDVGGNPLSGLDLSGTTHTNAATYNNDPWTFTSPSGNYNSASGTVNDAIAKANPVCTVTGYTVTYDASAHTATGSCHGAKLEALGGLDLTGTTRTAAGSGSDGWTFTAPNGNYNNASGSVTDTVSKAAPSCTVTLYHVTYDANPHTATGSCLGVSSEILAGLNLSGTTHTNAATYNNDPWTFTDVTGNYSNDSGTVNDTIDQAPNTIVFGTPPDTVNIGDTWVANATAASGGTVTFAIDAGTSTICHLDGDGVTVHFDLRGECDVNATSPATANYLAGSGQQPVAIADAAPVCATPAPVTVIMNVAKTGSVSCTDLEGDLPLTYNVDTQGTKGTAAFGGSIWTYTPDPNASGADTFKIVANDSLSATSAPVTVSVTIDNRAAKARNDTATVSAVKATSLNVTANDLAGYDSAHPTVEQDPGQPLTITAVGQGTLGRVTTDGHTLTYDPKGCSVGSDLVSYTISDGLTTSQAYVAITVARPGSGGISKTPLTDTPTAALVVGSKIASTVPVRLAWCGLTSTTTRGYRLLQSTNGGSTYPTTIYSSTTATSVSRSLSVGVNYAWAVRTGDGAGRYSAYAKSITTKLGRVDDKSTAIVYSTGWKSTGTSSSYSGGTEHYASSSAAAATLILPAGTRTFAIVAAKASTRGSYRVWVDGVLVKTISQKVSTTVYKLIQYVAGLTPGVSHTIVIKPYGNGPIGIDAILTIQ